MQKILTIPPMDTTHECLCCGFIGLRPYFQFVYTGFPHYCRNCDLLRKQDGWKQYRRDKLFKSYMWLYKGVLGLVPNVIAEAGKQTIFLRVPGWGTRGLGVVDTARGRSAILKLIARGKTQEEIIRMVARRITGRDREIYLLRRYCRGMSRLDIVRLMVRRCARRNGEGRVERAFADARRDYATPR